MNVLRVLVMLGALTLLLAPDQPLAQRDTLYRCPGKSGGPDEFTNDPTPEEARERGCKTLDGSPMPPTRDELIQQQKACINFWRQVIERQQRIAKESGFADKGQLYTAGSRVVDCQDQLKKLEQQPVTAKKK